MNTFNAFVSIPELANNAIGKIAKFGELSVPAKTYTKEIRNYSDAKAYPGIELITLAQLDKNSRTVEGTDSKIPNMALLVAKYFHTQYTENRIPLPSAKATLVTAVTNEFPAIRNIQIGKIENGEGTGKRLIDYIKYDYVADNVEWRCTLWFSDSALRRQYPLFDIVVIPPVGDVMRLNDKPATVLEALNSVKIDYVVNRIADITRDHKATTYHVYTTNWHDILGSDTILPTKWTVVIYGQSGVDQDMIKDAIRIYLTDNGPGVDWPKIFPDLFSENEFLLMPYWGQLATNILDHDDGLYSSITPFKVLQEQNDRLIPRSYGTDTARTRNILECFELIGTCYRGINIGVMGNPNNRAGLSQFSKQFPDYMATPTDKSDFSRMADKTQRFVLKLLEVLEMARDFNPGEELPADIARSVKGNREYLGFEFEGFNYYVLTRVGYLKDL